MAVIAKISNSKSAHASLAYALGKGQNKLKNATREWLESQGIDTSRINQRAVKMAGTNGIMPEMADLQFKATRQAFNQDKPSNQVLRVIQSFSNQELDPANQADWQQANDLGVKLAEELYPDHQTAVYTHIDGENHTLHNHLIVNKVNLKTGKKMREKPGQTVARAREINDNLAQQQGWKIIPKPADNVHKVEKDLGINSWRKQIKRTLDVVLTPRSKGEVKDWDTFTLMAELMGVKVNERGKSITYVLTDTDGKEHRVRANKLGTDYEKETIVNELENRTRQEQATSTSDDERTATRANERNTRHQRDIEHREQQFNNQISRRNRSLRVSNKATERIGKQIQRIREGIRHAQSAIRQLMKRFRRAVQATERRAYPNPEQRRETAQADPRPAIQADVGATKLFPLLKEKKDIARILSALNEATFAQLIPDKSGTMSNQIEVTNSTIKVDITKPITAETINNIGEEIGFIANYAIEDVAILANRGHKFSPRDRVRNPALAPAVNHQRSSSLNPDYSQNQNRGRSR